MKKLDPSFYQKPTLEVAKSLLGKTLVRRIGKQVVTGKIVETEGYIATIDAACHAYSGKTERNKHMFGNPGTIYVFFTYGCHFMLNVVTEPEGIAAAVLIRAIEPLSGLDVLIARRKTQSMLNLSNGPGKLTEAFDIDRKLSGESLQSEIIYIADAPELKREQISITTRVGITKSTELPWRFYIKDCPFVSPGKPSC
ncbi:MAG: DNA-3-methyladenine glycosylase [Chlorobiales bacterium]|nr:DNA-3-methyladenine glycosylase [Chlorobiales bacterium]